MSRRGRILVLTPRFPYPVIGGDRLRIHAICRALAREHSLTLLSLCEHRDDFDPALVTDTVFDRIERVYLPRWRSLMQVVAALPGQTPLQVAFYQSSDFARRIAELLPEHDLALAHLIRTGNYLVDQCIVPTVLEMTDAISMNYARVRDHAAGGLLGRVYALEQGRLQAYERRMPQAFTTVSMIAEGDARHLWGTSLSDNLVIASNGVDCNMLPWRDRVRNRPIVAFIGNMYTVQNMDACRHFVTEILPQIAEHDLIEFRIVGRIRDRDAAWFRTYPRVTVTGEVPSIPDAVADARVGVCPVRVGAGVQNKVLEYMALGLPVVCSPVGYEGISAVADRDLLVATTPAMFAAYVACLNIDEKLYCGFALNGRRFVETMHTWDMVLAPLTSRIRQQVATSIRSRTGSSELLVEPLKRRG